MTLTPYLKLMLEKNADSLSLKAGSPALLGLAGEEYPLGKNELTPNIIKEITFSLINDVQKQELVRNKALKFNCAAPDGEKFMASAKIADNGLVLFIVPDSALAKAEPAEQEAESYQVLGAAPEDDLNILPYLVEMAKLNASDLFLTVGSPVKAKIYGRAVALDEFLLTPELTKSGAFGIMTQEQIDEFLVTRDLDFAISLPDGSARFRANAFYQRKTVGLVMRLIPSVIPTGKDLGTPDILMELIMAKRGLLLMVGGTGSGKSTTLAAMINHRNANSAGHILTIEDPVEFSHPNLKSIVNQREVGVDTESYARALKACLREAPDVILIGEIRDRETLSAALELANTGHLCISTMHANNANQAMERVINMFPHDHHAQLFMDLAVNLNAVISQRLIPDTAGKRCAAIEVMINTPHIANLILKGELNEIKTAMTSSGSKGMRTFDDALFGLYTDGKISLEEALKNADSSNDLEARINFG
ncbi:PilT/PilU family type 4a pilus ATPase [Methylobacter tundripaludum]|uniref:PilT/PilU family type 4a pilus ATPase n=1 Tax=Methylobacter tundripaludum TaxID=173365 RepID=UPI0009DEF44F|nr:PilT/PilU family type 4a pilus ATPase [Methylobacter tundripaludum]